MFFQSQFAGRIFLGLLLSFGGMGGAALATDSSNECVQAILDAGISKEIIDSLLPRIQSHLEVFAAEARFLCLRTLGKPVALPRQGSAREQILKDLPGQDYSSAFSIMMHHEVQSRLDGYLPEGPLTTAQFRSQLYESLPSKGIVVLLHQKAEFREATLKRLSFEKKMRGLPRLAVADETDPVDGRLREELTSVKYCHDSFCAKGIKLASSVKDYQVHLLGGYLTESTFAALAVALRPIYEKKGAGRITFYIYNDAGYLPTPHADFVPLQNLVSLGRMDFEKMAGSIQNSFGFKSSEKAIVVRFVR